jgi:hypothetical protein
MCLSLQQFYTVFKKITFRTDEQWNMNKRPIYLNTDVVPRRKSSVRCHCFIFCDLFKDALNSSDYTVSVEWASPLVVWLTQVIREIEALGVSETSTNFYCITRRCILEDSILYFYFVTVLPRYLSFEIHDVFRISLGIKNGVTWPIFFDGGGGGSIRLIIFGAVVSSSFL